MPIEIQWITAKMPTNKNNIAENGWHLSLQFFTKKVILIFALFIGATEYISKFAVLGGEVAVPCTRNPL